jgi:hypothetical protein
VVTPEAAPHLWNWLRRCHARPGIQAAFAMGNAFFASRVAAVRELLGVAEAVAA